MIGCGDAAAGNPVYVEKPMAMDHAQALEMVDACRIGAVPLWVGYYRRARPRFLAGSVASAPIRTVPRAP